MKIQGGDLKGIKKAEKVHREAQRKVQNISKAQIEVPMSKKKNQRPDE